MTRLTKHIREQILANAQTKSGNRAARDATKQKRRDWAESIRLAAIGDRAADLEAIAAKVEKLRLQVPEEYRCSGSVVAHRGHIHVNLAGITLWVNDWDGNKVAPNSAVFTADNPLVQQFHDICAEEKANNDRWDQVKASVNAATGAVTTFKALLKAWPEAKELLPEHVEEAKVQLPAIQVADLNALVGLPSEA